MSYRRSFRFIRTHVLCERAPTGELEHDRELVYGALREGRCYIAVDSIAPARGFRFEAGDVPMGGEAPAGAPNGADPRAAGGAAAAAARRRADRGRRGRAAGRGDRGAGRLPGEALRRSKGRERTWILSNPIYLR